MGEKLERKPVKEEMRRIAVHEIGHAVISEIIIPVPYPLSRQRRGAKRSVTHGKAHKMTAIYIQRIT